MFFHQRHNEDLGDERYSGTVMWPGGDYSYQNKNITWNLPFEAGYDWHKRVDHVSKYQFTKRLKATL